MIFPLSVRFSKTIKETISEDQIKRFLGYSKEILYDKDADHIWREGNCLKFSNKVLSFGPSWTLMAGVDSGFLMITSDKNSLTKITYSYTIVTGFIIGFTLMMLLFIFSRDNIGTIMIFFGLILAWFISLTRQWIFFISITNDINELIIKEKQ